VCVCGGGGGDGGVWVGVGGVPFNVRILGPSHINLMFVVVRIVLQNTTDRKTREVRAKD
jgi:hypothetical protein